MAEVPKLPDVLEVIVDFPFVEVPNYLYPLDEAVNDEAVVMKSKVVEDLRAVYLLLLLLSLTMEYFLHYYVKRQEVLMNPIETV
jgi:hypothetical protein